MRCDFFQELVSPFYHLLFPFYCLRFCGSYTFYSTMTLLFILGNNGLRACVFSSGCNRLIYIFQCNFHIRYNYHVIRFNWCSSWILLVSNAEIALSEHRSNRMRCRSIDQCAVIIHGFDFIQYERNYLLHSDFHRRSLHESKLGHCR